MIEAVIVNAHRKTVVLPKIISWFLGDFNNNKKNNIAAVPADCLPVIAPYLKGEAKADLLRMLADGVNPSVRFRHFNFRCRAFTKLNITKTLSSTPVTAIMATPVGATQHSTEIRKMESKEK